MVLRVQTNALWRDIDKIPGPISITAANSPYQAEVAEVVYADCTAGPITILAPAIDLTEAGRAPVAKTFTVKKMDGTINEIAITATKIESRGVIGTSAALSGKFESVTFSVDEGGRHMPSGSFHIEALDWYFKAAHG